VGDTNEVIERFRRFSTDRDWSQFHDPKSLVLALVGEVGELAELFQWLPADRAKALAADEPLRTRVGEEIGDVLVYLLALADALGVDAVAAAVGKIDTAEGRYPSAEFRGRAPDKATP
jgi:dCTP diphosphatase